MPTSGTYSRFAWAVRPDATAGNRQIRATVNGVAATLVFAATGPFFWRADGTADDMVIRLNTCLASHPQAPVVMVSISSAGMLSIEMNLSFTIHWGDALTTIDESWFGATPIDWVGLFIGPNWKYTSTAQVGHAWYPEEWYDDDSGSEAGHLLARSETLGTRVDVLRYGPRAVRRIAVSFLGPEKIYSAEAALNEAFDLLHAAMATGELLEWTPDVVAATWVITRWNIADEEWLQTWPIDRPIDRFARYSVELPLLGYVA